MEQTQKTDKRMALVGIAVVVVVIAAIIVASVFIFGSTKKETASTTTSPSPSPTIATKDEVQKSLTNLDTTMKQAATDQAAAKTAIQDGTSQIKVAN